MFKKIIRPILVPIISIVLAVLIAAIFVMMSTGYGYFDSLGTLIETIYMGSFGSINKISDTMTFFTVLLLTGLANAVAFRTGLFNIGVEGQFIIGGLVATIVGFIPGLPMIVHVPLMILAGIIAGALWAAIPGYLKAKRGTNEVVNTIMLNYIALWFSNYIIKYFISDGSNPYSKEIESSSMLYRFFEGGNNANIGIFFSLIAVVIVAVLISRSRSGYELRAVGLSPYAAEYGGVSIKKNIVLAMVISGALAGLAGASYTGGVNHKIFYLTTMYGFGTDGITVSLIGKNNPIGVIFSALLIASLNASQSTLQGAGIPKQIVFIIQAIIIIFVAADYVFNKYLLNRKKSEVVA
ncbi:Sugar ABC transporter, permease protein [Clostridium bornimense]|uniref:Sugar ABC transporter, permease protein n=1 Tax=Clostridium bornimense TaxID=1216932 RepID=W6RWY7_9CLOT|nr:ABC transporter permease [Clostridium bornimense]CDM68149.1 Sugar ABC transporter, permease protein [Clostridium bornimense]